MRQQTGTDTVQKYEVSQNLDSVMEKVYEPFFFSDTLDLVRYCCVKQLKVCVTVNKD